MGLELVEEPTHGLQAVREVRERVAARVAIDETAAEHGALGAGVADAVCLKISRCGGIAGLLAAAALVRASGAEVYLASTLDGPLGVAAAVHAAAALASRGPLPACGLATLGLFEGLEQGEEEGVALPVRNGRIAVPTPRGWASIRLRAPERPPPDSPAATRGPRARRPACPLGSSSTIRRPNARNFPSRSPTSTVTGIASSGRRSHSGCISPVPSPRMTAASASGRLRR